MTTKGRPCGPKSRKHHFLINFPSLTPIFNHLHFCREMHNVFNLLLASLCVADSMFLLCNIAIAPVAFGRMDLLTPGDGDILTMLVMLSFAVLYTSLECGVYVSLASSIFITVSLTFERFQVIFTGFHRIYSPLNLRFHSFWVE